MRKVLLPIDYQKGFKSDCSKATENSAYSGYYE